MGKSGYKILSARIMRHNGSQEGRKKTIQKLLRAYIIKYNIYVIRMTANYRTITETSMDWIVSL